MPHLQDIAWSLLFALAVAVLMLAILLMRSAPVANWVLVVYPAVGAMLAHVASRTSPNVDEMARIESSTIAAAAVLVLAGLINLLIGQMVLNEMLTGAMSNGTPLRQVGFFVLPAVSALLWLALQRRFARLRREAAAGRVEETRLDARPAHGPAGKTATRAA